MKKLPLLLLTLLTMVALSRCANPGSGPDGGPYDETPPRLVSTTPKLGSTNSQAKRITLVFDEYIKMENASEKVIVSPPQINAPDVRASGKSITVTLNDTLKPNTTYTVDFGDAIEDNNEGNPFGDFAFYYSTGASIDTLEVSGYVLNAADLEPVKGMLVGLQSDLADSAFRTRPFDRVGHTDSYGHFSIRGVAPGSYRVYALQDMDGTFSFSQKSEAIAFSKDIIKPACEPAIRFDTVWHDSVHIDSLREVHYTRFTPDDILLLSFTETGQPRHLLKTERSTPGLMSFYFTAPSDSMPVITGLNFNADEDLVKEYSLHNDTINCWIRNQTALANDTLRLTLRYEETNDSTNQMQMRTDTLELTPRKTFSKIKEERDEAWKKWAEEREKALKRGRDFSDAPPIDWLGVRVAAPSNMSPTTNPLFTFDEPLSRIDTSRIHLLLGPDSAAVERPFKLVSFPRKLTQLMLMGEWRPNQQYQLRVDSAAFFSLTGRVNQRIKTRVTIADPETFGSIFFVLQGPGADSALVQIFTDEKKIYRQVKAHRGMADFYYVNPGGYYARAIVDLNGNGRWDAGDYEKGLQPEPVYYYPGQLQLRAGWDINQDWNLTGTPLIHQKPDAIKKQKADPKKTIKNRNAERLRQLGRQ